MNKEIERCKNCYWYRWEDSVWGYCWRLPPKEIMVKWFPRIKYKMERPEVLREEIACGEFRNNNKP